jgi:hypothetical protein
MPMSVQDHPQHRGQAQEGMSTKSKAIIVLIGFLLIAGALLFTEHRTCSGCSFCCRFLPVR